METWTNPKGIRHKIIAVSEDEIVFASPNLDKLDEFAEELRQDHSVEGELRIPVSRVKEIFGEAGSEIAMLKIEDTGNKTFLFQDPAERNAFFDELTNTFSRDESQLPPMRSASPAGCGAAVIALITFLGVQAAQQIAIGNDAEIQGKHRAAKRLFVWFVDLFGSVGIGVIGGAIIAALIFSAIKSVRNPSIMVTLKPRI